MSEYDVMENFILGIGGILVFAIILIYIAMLAVLVFYIVCNFKVFKKMGLPGWYCLIPFFGSYQQTKKIYDNGWWFLCSVIPVVGIAYRIKFQMDYARCFGFEWWFGFVLLFLPIVGQPVMAFDKNHQYTGIHEGGPLTL